MAGNQPDVRVRLSAEGQQEVVKAFRQVQKQAEQTGRKGAKGMGLLNNSLQTFKRLLPAIALTAVVVGVVRLAKSTIDAADELAKMSQRTGIAVETLSALELAAELAGASMEDVSTGLARLARTASDATRGLETARRPFRDLGIEVARTDGTLRPIEEILNDVAKALFRLPDGTKKTALAQELLGRAGAKLIPLFNDLGQRGFPAVREEMEKMGGILTTDLARAAEDFNDDLTRMGRTVQALALQFSAEFLPVLADTADALAAATTGKGTSGFRLLGRVAGDILVGLVLLITAVTFGFVELGANVGSILLNLARFTKNLITQGPVAAWENFKADLKRDTATIDNFIRERETKILAALSGQTREAERARERARGARQTANLANLEEQERQAKAARALQEQLFKNELALLKATLKLQAAEEKIGFDRRITSLEDFFDARRRILKEQAVAEIEILEKRALTERARPLLATETELDRKKKLAALENQIAVRRLALEEQLLVLFSQERNTIKQTQKEVEQFERKLLGLQGERFAIARAELQDQADKFEEILVRQGIADEERRRRVGAFAAAGEARIAFDEIKESGRQALAELAADRRAIEAQVQQGLLFQFQGENQIMTLEQQRLPLLQQIAAALLQAAESTSDPELIARAGEFADSIRDLGIESNRAAQEMANFRASVEQSLTGELTNFFTQGIENAESFGDAMRGLALSVVDSLRKIVAQMLATLLVQKLLGAFGLPIKAASGGEVRAAGGGLIRGPGTRTSDSIAALLSDGEFVVKASVVQQPGSLEFLREYNREGLPVLKQIGYLGFAEGGLVELEGAPARGAANGKADLTIGLDETLLLKRLEASPMFSRVLVRTLDRHRKAANNALGRGVQ